jgi:hypothetical protein
MPYVLFSVMAALWVFVNGMRRKAKAFPWAIGALLLPPIVLPVYLALRPLKPGEVRKGGKAWNILRNFAILWTLWFLLAATMMGAIPYILSVRNGIEKFTIKTIIDNFRSFGEIGILWFVPLAIALFVGLFLRKPSFVEKGPTGPRASSQS